MTKPETARETASGFDLRPSWLATAKHLREMLKGERHTEAVSDCRHCTMKYAAITLEELAAVKHFSQPADSPALDLEGAAEEIVKWFFECDGTQPQKERETVTILRKHFRSPAPEGELARVKGRRVTIRAGCGIYQGKFSIHDADSPVFHLFNGEWVNGDRRDSWDTYESVMQFIRQHADQPAAVSPDASAEQGDRTSGGVVWSNPETDSATVSTAPAEGSELSEIAKLLAIVRVRTHRELGCVCERCVEDEYQTAKVIDGLREQLAAAEAEIRGVKGFAGWDREDDRPADSAAAEMFNEITQLRDELASLKRQVEAAEKKLSAAGVCAECGVIGGHSCYCEKGGY